ncbi:internal scaffolding protein [Apis mellifera associated microvirus 16]|nr:internal scaffolding protein [Apis mellifera associated microvirus 16]
MSQKQAPSSVKIRKRFDDHSRVSDATALVTGDETLVKQSFKDECDINLIVERNKATGLLTHVREGQPMYGDFTAVTNYEAALQVVIEAENMFADLPSHVRDFFANNPAEFVNFASNPENADKLVEMGLAYVLPQTPAIPAGVTSGSTSSSQQDAPTKGQEGPGGKTTS